MAPFGLCLKHCCCPSCHGASNGTMGPLPLESAAVERGQLKEELEWQFSMLEWGAAMGSAARQREWKTGTAVPDSCHLLWLLCLVCSTHCRAPSAAAGCSLEYAESRENKLEVSKNVVGWDTALVGI